MRCHGAVVLFTRPSPGNRRCFTLKKGPFDFVGIGDDSSTQPEASFDQFEATELYCPKCSRAVPVRKSLLLILPSGDKYEYCCQHCGETVGDKIDHSGQFYDLLKT
jgi:hypothetical protein